MCGPTQVTHPLWGSVSSYMNWGGCSKRPLKCFSPGMKIWEKLQQSGEQPQPHQEMGHPLLLEGKGGSHSLSESSFLPCVGHLFVLFFAAHQLSCWKDSYGPLSTPAPCPRVAEGVLTHRAVGSRTGCALQDFMHLKRMRARLWGPWPHASPHVGGRQGPRRLDPFTGRGSPACAKLMDCLSNPLKLECFEETINRLIHTAFPLPHPENIKKGKAINCSYSRQGKHTKELRPPQRPLGGLGGRAWVTQDWVSASPRGTSEKTWRRMSSPPALISATLGKAQEKQADKPILVLVLSRGVLSSSVRAHCRLCNGAMPQSCLQEPWKHFVNWKRATYMLATGTIFSWVLILPPQPECGRHFLKTPRHQAHPGPPAGCLLNDHCMR